VYQRDWNCHGGGLTSSSNEKADGKAELITIMSATAGTDVEILTAFVSMGFF
jgi:hypothetical protein